MSWFRVVQTRLFESFKILVPEGFVVLNVTVSFGDEIHYLNQPVPIGGFPDFVVFSGVRAKAYLVARISPLLS